MVDLLKNIRGLNEAVNFEKESIFVAIPKTGSTTVRIQLTPEGPYFVAANHLNIVQIRDLMRTYLLLNQLGKNSTFPTQNVLANADVAERADRTFESFFKFASVRNPWARAVSLFFRQEGVRVASVMSFEQFCERHIFASDPGLFTNPLAVDFSACDASLVAGSFAAGESRVLPQLCDSHLRHERREEAAVEASGTATGDPAVA